MVCYICRTAGEAQTRMGPSPAVRDAHLFCRGGNWCDCQHTPGIVLNPERVSTSNQRPK